MKTRIKSAYIKVRSANGTYQTNTINGLQASCTAGERQAAERLAVKLFGGGSHSVKEIPQTTPEPGVTQWHLRAGQKK